MYLAWRNPGTGEPSGLPSMGSHRVGHDWSDLAAAAGCIYQSVTQGKCLRYGRRLFFGTTSKNDLANCIQWRYLYDFVHISLWVSRIIKWSGSATIWCVLFFFLLIKSSPSFHHSSFFHSLFILFFLFFIVVDFVIHLYLFFKKIIEPIMTKHLWSHCLTPSCIWHEGDAVCSTSIRAQSLL